MIKVQKDKGMLGNILSFMLIIGLSVIQNLKVAGLYVLAAVAKTGLIGKQIVEEQRQAAADLALDNIQSERDARQINLNGTVLIGTLLKNNNSYDVLQQSQDEDLWDGAPITSSTMLREMLEAGRLNRYKQREIYSILLDRQYMLAKVRAEYNWNDKNHLISWICNEYYANELKNIESLQVDVKDAIAALHPHLVHDKLNNMLSAVSLQSLQQELKRDTIIWLKNEVVSNFGIVVDQVNFDKIQALNVNVVESVEVKELTDSEKKALGDLKQFYDVHDDSIELQRVMTAAGHRFAAIKDNRAVTPSGMISWLAQTSQTVAQQFGYELTVDEARSKVINCVSGVKAAVKGAATYAVSRAV